MELARQLTLIDFHNYHCIRPTELLNTAWSSKQKEKKAMNVLVLTRRFNQVANWVSYLILQMQSPQERARVISYFIDVQHHLLNLKNLHGLMAIHASLCSSPIARLSKSWSLVSPLALASFGIADKLVSPQSNYKSYRKFLADAMPGPCIPYIGVDLTALTMLAEQHTKIENQSADLPLLLNVSKMQKIAVILDTLTQLQSCPYPLFHLPIIQEFLCSDPSFLKAQELSVQQVYDISLQREPRKDDSAPTRGWRLPSASSMMGSGSGASYAKKSSSSPPPSRSTFPSLSSFLRRGSSPTVDQQTKSGSPDPSPDDFSAATMAVSTGSISLASTKKAAPPTRSSSIRKDE